MAARHNESDGEARAARQLHQQLCEAPALHRVPRMGHIVHNRQLPLHLHSRLHPPVHTHSPPPSRTQDPMQLAHFNISQPMTLKPACCFRKI